MNCNETQAVPAEYSNPTETVKVKLGIAGFVDDCNGQTNKIEANGSTETVPKI